MKIDFFHVIVRMYRNFAAFSLITQIIDKKIFVFFNYYKTYFMRHSHRQ